MADRLLHHLLHRLRAAAAASGAGLTDAELLGRFADASDQAGFEALVWRHAALVVAVCRRVLGHEQDVEDAFQATFLVLARKAGAVRRRGAVGHWLARVAYRVALRARGRNARATAPRPSTDSRPTSDPADEAERQDLRRVLDEEVRRLPAKYRAAVALRYQDGRTTAEAAAALDCPQGTVLSRLAWARRRLRERLAARGLGLPAAVAAVASESAGAVSAHWVASAVEAARAFAAGGRAGSRAAGPVALAEGVLRAMLMTKLRVGAVLAVGALAAGASLFLPSPTAGQPDRPPGAVPPAEVTVVRPVRREAAEHLDFVGRTEAAATVEVRPRVTGLLEKVAVRPGAKVKRGDLLFELDDRHYRADVAKAEAEVQRAEARLRRASADVDRARARKDAGLSLEELDRVTAARDEAQADLRAARAGLERARLDLEATRVTAPVDGQAGRPLLDAGNLASPATPLVAIVATDPVYAAIDVNEQAFLRLRALVQAGEVTALLGLAGEDGFPRRGRVESVDNRADPATGTVLVRAAFPNAGGEVVPGLSARVRLVTGGPREVLLVPVGAVQSAAGRPFVLVVGSNGAVEWRAVTLGPAEGGLRVVREGVGPDDRVIVGGLAGVKPGEPVRARDADRAKLGPGRDVHRQAALSVAVARPGGYHRSCRPRRRIARR
jgi:RND family efflux transporter MFP subunit